MRLEDAQVTVLLNCCLFIDRTSLRIDHIIVREPRVLRKEMIMKKLVLLRVNFHASD